jgi:hypothetical protein
MLIFAPVEMYEIAFALSTTTPFDGDGTVKEEDRRF